MTSKEKLIGLAQRVQVAAQAAGFKAQLVLGDDGADVSALHAVEYTRVFQIYMPYDSTDEMQASILGSLAEFLTLGDEKKGGEA